LSQLKFQKYPKTPLKALFTAAGNDTLDLLEKMLNYDPNKRLTTREVKLHASCLHDLLSPIDTL